MQFEEGPVDRGRYPALGQVQDLENFRHAFHFSMVCFGDGCLESTGQEKEARHDASERLDLHVELTL
ncbi:hypothetical protein RUM44_012291 [Polyplax serrata]|uniref:Uncharacterized protein n=1 Tax=Polyplax serrata TaxID=468196 RepID=A0ABR1BFB1_POLSC